MRLKNRRQFVLTAGGAGGLAALGLLRSLTRGISAAEPDDGAAAENASGLQTVNRTALALGSEISMTVLHESRAIAEKAVAAAFAEIGKIDEIMSLYRPVSQLSRLNREGKLDKPHPYLRAVLEKARAVSKRTAGAFDVTVQPLWQLYAAAKKAGKLPDATAVKHARGKVDWQKIDVTRDRVKLLSEGMAVTLNGIAQGFAGDRALAALRDNGIEHALVNTGEIGTVGGKRDGKPWKVGIQHPRREDAYVALAKVAGRCMATSGDYETSFSRDHSYNHIFDPRTGRSPDAFSSVTVLAPTGLDADAMSTAIFVMGAEKGLRWVRSEPDTEALFVLKDGKILATDGFPQAT